MNDWKSGFRRSASAEENGIRYEDAASVARADAADVRVQLSAVAPQEGEQFDDLVRSHIATIAPEWSSDYQALVARETCR